MPCANQGVSLISFRNKVAIVTGSGQGIGAAIAWKLGSLGAHVILAEVDESKGRFRERWLRERGIDSLFIKTDVSDEEQVRNMVRKTVERYGRIDVLVNNAGIGLPPKELFDQTIEEWNRVIDVNLKGVWLCSKYVAMEMRDKGGVIVNIASTRALQSEPGTEPYSASKGGVVSLTHSLAISLAKYGIRVVCVSPGWVDTSEWQIPPRKPELTRLDNLQHPAGRVGNPLDIANVVAFLASDEAAWITGANIVVDGGMTRKMIYIDEETIGEAAGTLTSDKELSTIIMKLLKLPPDKLRKVKTLIHTLSINS